jgi:hypothetical protein
VLPGNGPGLICAFALLALVVLVAFGLSVLGPPDMVCAPVVSPFA